MLARLIQRWRDRRAWRAGAAFDSVTIDPRWNYQDRFRDSGSV